MIEMLFDNFSTIDVHDHYRQGSLALEEGWKTQPWWHRIFAKLFGCIITDCFLAHRISQMRKGADYDDFALLSGRLGYELVNNTFKRSEIVTRARLNRIDALAQATENPTSCHHLAKPIDLDMYQYMRGSDVAKAKKGGVELVT